MSIGLGVEPAAFDSKVFGHPVEVLHGIWLTDEMPLGVAIVDHISLHIRKEAPQVIAVPQGQK